MRLDSIVLEFRILGPLEVLRDGVALQLGGSKQPALLAVLLLHAGRVVSSDRLVDALWGGEAPRTAVNSLQNLVSQLRKQLGHERLTTRAPGYVLYLGPGELDLERFRALVDEAAGQPAGERSRLFAQALELWYGPALADVADAEFARADVARLEELRLTALEARIEADLEDGRGAQLVAELEGLCREHPYRERVHGQLMLALYRAGRQAEALAVFARVRRCLVDELGIEPSPALRGVHRLVLRQSDGDDQTSIRVTGDRNALHCGSGPAAGAVIDLEPVCAELARTLAQGRLVVVIGGDNSHLADALALAVGIEAAHERPPAALAQRLALRAGAGALHDAVDAALDAPAQATLDVTAELAALSSWARAHDAPQPIFVTLACDEALEHALGASAEPHDVVAYLPSSRGHGRFLHRSSDGVHAVVINEPNTYVGALEPGVRTIVVKLRGDRSSRDVTGRRDTLTLTEDDHLRLAGERALATQLPVGLAAALRRSHLLLIDVDVADWCERLLVNRLCGDGPAEYASWSVRSGADVLERRIWARRGVEFVDASPVELLAALATRLDREEVGVSG